MPNHLPVDRKIQTRSHPDVGPNMESKTDSWCRWWLWPPVRWSLCHHHRSFCLTRPGAWRWPCQSQCIVTWSAQNAHSVTIVPPISKFFPAPGNTKHSNITAINIDALPEAWATVTMPAEIGPNHCGSLMMQGQHWCKLVMLCHFTSLPSCSPDVSLQMASQLDFAPVAPDWQCTMDQTFHNLEHLGTTIEWTSQGPSVLKASPDQVVCSRQPWTSHTWPPFLIKTGNCPAELCMVKLTSRCDPPIALPRNLQLNMLRSDMTSFLHSTPAWRPHQGLSLPVWWYWSIPWNLSHHSLQRCQACGTCNHDVKPVVHATQKVS